MHFPHAAFIDGSSDAYDWAGVDNLAPQKSRDSVPFRFETVLDFPGIALEVRFIIRTARGASDPDHELAPR